MEMVPACTLHRIRKTRRDKPRALPARGKVKFSRQGFKAANSSRTASPSLQHPNSQTFATYQNLTTLSPSMSSQNLSTAIAEVEQCIRKHSQATKDTFDEIKTATGDAKITRGYALYQATVCSCRIYNVALFRMLTLGSGRMAKAACRTLDGCSH